MRLRCANDRAADIGNYSLRNSRVHLLRPPPSPLACAFVSYRPSPRPSRLLFPLDAFLRTLYLPSPHR